MEKEDLIDKVIIFANIGEARDFFDYCEKNDIRVSFANTTKEQTLSGKHDAVRMDKLIVTGTEDSKWYKNHPEHKSKVVKYSDIFRELTPHIIENYEI